MTIKDKERFISQLKKYLESDQGSLPIFSAISLQIQLELVKENPNLKVIVQLISEDQALSSAVLRVSNSVTYCGLFETTTVSSAIVRLGMAEVMRIVCSDISHSIFSSKDAKLNVLLNNLWQHSVGCAFSSGMLASSFVRGVQQDEAFHAGLFHDIGKLHILKVIEEKRKVYKLFDIPEEMLFDTINSMHARQGYRLMQQLKLPLMYAVVARDLHLRKIDPDNKLLVIVRMANKICHSLGIGTSKDSSLDLVGSEEAEILGLGEEEIEKAQMFLLSNNSLMQLMGA